MSLAAESPAVLGCERPTTLMIRNLPRKFAAWDMVAELRLHALPGTFDFVYVPWDRKGVDNVGYAFANFLDATLAAEVLASMNGADWRTGFRCRPIKVQPAHVQGLDANLSRFEEQGAFVDPDHAPLLFAGGEPTDLEGVRALRPEPSCGASTATTCWDGCSSAEWTSSEAGDASPPGDGPVLRAPGLELGSAAGFRPPPGFEDVVLDLRRSPGYAASRDAVCDLLQQLLASSSRGARNA